MSTPPSRFWPGALTPLRVCLVVPCAVWRFLSSFAGRQISPDGMQPSRLPGSSFFCCLPLPKLVPGCARLAKSVFLFRISLTDEPEYCYEHSPPLSVVLL